MRVSEFVAVGGDDLGIAKSVTWFVTSASEVALPGTSDLQLVVDDRL